MDFSNQKPAEFWMTVAGTISWGVCSWWMGRISAKQNRLMDKLRDQGARIEKFSKVDHYHIKEVHPQVAEIKHSVNQMIATVKDQAAIQSGKGNSSNTCSRRLQFIN